MAYDRRAYDRQYVIDNAERNALRRRAQRDRAMAYLAAAKADRPCADCGIVYPPVCMDFDHLTDKRCDVGRLARDRASVEVLAAEIAKCELVCANCHRIRTAKRGTWGAEVAALN